MKKQARQSASYPHGSGEALNARNRISAALRRSPPPPTPRLAYGNDSCGVWIYQGNSLELLDAIAGNYPDGRFDMIFADPPYFLSNGGITCHAWRMECVNKGAWDKSRSPEFNHEFNLGWLRRCQRVLKPNRTLRVT